MYLLSSDLDRRRYTIVIISNQKLSKELEEWKQKVHLIAASVGQHLLCDRAFNQRFSQLPNVPFRIFAASADDEYRKPMLGMLHALEGIYTSGNAKMGKFHHRSTVFCYRY